MKLAVFGGSFNPIHSAHLFLADEIRCDAGIDRVIFVPANISPFKLDRSDVVAPKLRLEMIKTAISNESRFCVDDCEIRRSGISYTDDTIDEIMRKYASEIDDGRIFLIIGDDLTADFAKWRNAAKIAEKCDILVGARNGALRGKDFFVSHGQKFRCRCFSNAKFPLSSSEIRARIASGRSWRYFVPDAVAKIIVENGLYGA